MKAESSIWAPELNQNAVINTLNSTPSSNNQFDTHVHVKNNKFYNEPRLIEYKRFELKPKELGIDASFQHLNK